MAEVLLEAMPPIQLLLSFTVVQGETLSSLDWSETHWCQPAITWHHVDAAGIDKLWQFEQSWRESRGASEPILFADYFDAFIHPHLTAANGTLAGWDNLSGDWTVRRGEIVDSAYETAEACETVYHHNPKCLQWAWSPGLCRGGRLVRLGWALDNRPALGSADGRIAHAAENDGAVSGWLLDRIEAFRAAQGSCGGSQLR